MTGNEAHRHTHSVQEKSQLTIVATYKFLYSTNDYYRYNSPKRILIACKRWSTALCIKVNVLTQRRSTKKWDELVCTCALGETASRRALSDVRQFHLGVLITAGAENVCKSEASSRCKSYTCTSMTKHDTHMHTMCRNLRCNWLIIIAI